MDSGDIYYSDNSQLMESHSPEWIATDTVLINSPNLTWTEDGPELTVENDDYMTAAETEESGNSTQYFSVLDPHIDSDSDYSTNEPTPNCVMNIEVVSTEESILPDPTKETEDINLDDKVGEDEVILYRTDDSDDLYAIQIADDGDGTLRQYKFKVRQNANGQLEAIPGSIEVHTANDNSDDEEDEQNMKMISTVVSQESTSKPGTSTQESQDKRIKKIPKDFSNSNYNVNSPFEPDQDEEYQIVEGVHVTGDSEDTGDSLNKSLRQTKDDHSSDDLSESDYEVETLEDAYRDDSIVESSSNEVSQVLQHKSNVGNLEEPQKDKIIVIFKDEKHFNDVMVKEKENVYVNSTKMQSILKSNVTAKTEQSVKDSKPHVPKIISSDVKLKPKDIATNQTIPVKSARQPRKQTITPIERGGSEIIVQPLVYTVEENDEHSSRTHKRKRISEVLQISDDSDPEYTLKPTKKRKKIKHSKRGRPKNSLQITIVDTDEEDIIEVTDEDDSDDESISTKEDTEEGEATESTVKNVPEEVKLKEDIFNVDKTQIKENVKSPEPTEKEENDKEINNLEEDEDSGDEAEKVKERYFLSTKVIKKVNNSPRKNRCSFCPKTFPNAGTLRRHMNLHCRRNSLRSKKEETATVPPQENEYKGPELQVTLSRKVKEEMQKLYCTKCKLQFHLPAQYNRHSMIHKTIKQKTLPMVNKKVPPARKKEPRLLRSSDRQIKAVSLEVTKKTTTEPSKEDRFKCDFCSQTFDQRKLLFIHRKTHKLFPCRNCKKTFGAKVMLDEHLRKSCIIAFRQSPRLTRNSKAIVCEQCNKTFLSQISLETHKRTAHETSIVTNNIPRKKTLLYRKKGAHGGVPMSLKLQKALNAVQKK